MAEEFEQTQAGWDGTVEVGLGLLDLLRIWDVSAAFVRGPGI